MNEAVNKRKHGVALVGVATLALTGGYLLRGAGVGAQPTPDTPGAPVATTNQTPVVQTPATRDAAAIQNAFAQVSEAVEPAVVTITTKSRAPRNPTGAPGVPRLPRRAPGSAPGGGDPFEEFFRQFERNFGFRPNALQREDMRARLGARFRTVQDGRGGGLGSGMIFRPDGYILTNAHVVSGAEKDGITVTMTDDKGEEREFSKVKLVGSDERTDIAVLKIEANNLPVVRLGDSSKVRVGDWAIAVGNPFGLEHTLTVGVISAKTREIRNLGGRGLTIRNTDYIQTDASINPGNSGGPLCDINGRVIGVNNAIYSPSGGLFSFSQGGNVGIGFAIPINVAHGIAQQLVKSGKVTRGYLGVQISDENDFFQGYGLNRDTKGILVTDVSPNTPGARAGLQPGDVIQAFNNQAVSKSTELQRMVGSAPVGSTVQLKVLRGGQSITLNARLDELTDQDSASPPAMPGQEEEADNPIGTPSLFGMSLRSLTPQLASRLGVAGSNGVLITKVAEGSDAADAGLQPGDVIERVGPKAVTSQQSFENEARAILKGQTGERKVVALSVNRRGERVPVMLTIEK